VGQPYTFALEHNCSGSSTTDVTTWTLSGQLPPGLRFSGDGRFSGTPTAAGSYSLNISLLSSTSYAVADSVRETRTFELVIRPPTGRLAGSER
jgi:Putative Ig domain